MKYIGYIIVHSVLQGGPRRLYWSYSKSNARGSKLSDGKGVGGQGRPTHNFLLHLTS